MPGIIRRTLRLSPVGIVDSTSSLRLRAELFFIMRWPLPVLLCMIFPVPVTVNRFAADFFVLIFGIRVPFKTNFATSSRSLCEASPDSDLGGRLSQVVARGKVYFHSQRPFPDGNDPSVARCSDAADASTQVLGVRIIVIVRPSSPGGFSIAAISAVASAIRSRARLANSG